MQDPAWQVAGSGEGLKWEPREGSEFFRAALGLIFLLLPGLSGALSD